MNSWILIIYQLHFNNCSELFVFIVSCEYLFFLLCLMFDIFSCKAEQTSWQQMSMCTYDCLITYPEVLVLNILAEEKEDLQMIAKVLRQWIARSHLIKFFQTIWKEITKIFLDSIPKTKTKIQSTMSKINQILRIWDLFQ